MPLSQIRTTQKHSQVNVRGSHQAEIADCWHNNKFTLIVDETPELVFFFLFLLLFIKQMWVWVWSQQVWKICFYHQSWRCRALSQLGVFFNTVFWNIANHNAITQYPGTVSRQRISMIRDVVQMCLLPPGVLMHLPPCSWKGGSSHRRLWLTQGDLSKTCCHFQAAGQGWLCSVCLRTLLAQGICNPCKPGSNAVISQLDVEWHTQHFGAGWALPSFKRVNGRIEIRRNKFSEEPKADWHPCQALVLLILEWCLQKSWCCCTHEASRFERTDLWSRGVYKSWGTMGSLKKHFL